MMQDVKSCHKISYIHKIFLQNLSSGNENRVDSEILSEYNNNVR